MLESTVLRYNEKNLVGLRNGMIQYSMQTVSISTTTEAMRKAFRFVCEVVEEHIRKSVQIETQTVLTDAQVIESTVFAGLYKTAQVSLWIGQDIPLQLLIRSNGILGYLPWTKHCSMNYHRWLWKRRGDDSTISFDETLHNLLIHT